MVVESIPLRFAGEGRVAHLRDLTGRDEFGVLGVSTAYAIALLEALIESPLPDAAERDRAAELTAADRDRLLATVYERAFGDCIESTLTCGRCGLPFELSFSLRRLRATVDERTAAGEWKLLGDGRCEGTGGLRLRLPTGDDELALVGLTPREAESFLMSRCLEGGNWSGDRARLEQLLDEAAPLLDQELAAPCAECGHVNNVQFDIQTYLLGAILTERRQLLSEVNRIAAAYGWSLDAILSLRRQDRRQIVELIDHEQTR